MDFIEKIDEIDEMWDCRTRALVGNDGVEKLKKSRITIFGIGGVGSFAAEALARAGIGCLTLVDFDTVNLSNLNRQIIALTNTIGRLKTDVMKERMQDISPEAIITAIDVFVGPDTIEMFNLADYDFVVDAVDNVTAKLLIINKCYSVDTPVISCMGTGNKLDPSRFRISDISKTNTCPLARVVRRELKKSGISKCLVLWSDEEPVKNETGERLPGSVSFVPAVAGLRIAGEVILRLGDIKRG